MNEQTTTQTQPKSLGRQLRTVFIVTFVVLIGTIILVILTNKLITNSSDQIYSNLIPSDSSDSTLMTDLVLNPSPIGTGTDNFQLTTTNQNIYAWAFANNYTAFVDAVDKANLSAQLQTGGTFTVFVFTNDAYARLPSNTPDTVRDEILKSHIVNSRIAIEDMYNLQSITTQSNQVIPVQVEGRKIRIGNVYLNVPYVEASNGVVYVVNDLIVMPR